MDKGILILSTKFTNVLGIFVALFSTWEEEGFAVVFFMSFIPLPLVIFLNGKIDGSFIKSILCVPLLNLI